MRVLVIEDERRLAEALEQVLKSSNYSVDLAFDGEEGLYLAQTDAYDVLVIDVMLPKLDGLGVVRELRAGQHHAPVLLLTAKAETRDRVEGLDSGADDYLTKPFQLSELLARLRALTRRTSEVQPQGIKAYGDLELNPFSLELWVGQQSFRLTKKESQLLEVLINNQGHAVSISTINQRLWGPESSADNSRVKVYASFLRKKLAQLESTVTVKAIRGVGYMLVEQTRG